LKYIILAKESWLEESRRVLIAYCTYLIDNTDFPIDGMLLQASCSSP